MGQKLPGPDLGLATSPIPFSALALAPEPPPAAASACYRHKFRPPLLSVHPNFKAENSQIQDDFGGSMVQAGPLPSKSSEIWVFMPVTSRSRLKGGKGRVFGTRKAIWILGEAGSGSDEGSGIDSGKGIWGDERLEERSRAGVLRDMEVLRWESLVEAKFWKMRAWGNSGYAVQGLEMLKIRIGLGSDEKLWWKGFARQMFLESGDGEDLQRGEVWEQRTSRGKGWLWRLGRRREVWEFLGEKERQK